MTRQVKPPGFELFFRGVGRIGWCRVGPAMRKTVFRWPFGPRGRTATCTGDCPFPPMPGRIVSVDVKVRDQVKEGQGVLVLEAMKMQNELTAPTDGLMKAVQVKPGQTVDGNAALVEFK